VNEVVALDPEPAMLAAAADYVRERGVRISLQQGSSYDLGAHLGMFQLVTMGRSFHWMDRPATLEPFWRRLVKGGAWGEMAPNLAPVLSAKSIVS
jgi:ubiquinone/menaquinone biosynthesis C-methylase UbiE